MFKITPIQDENEKFEVARLCGAESIDGYFAYAMRDAESGMLMGFSQFEIGGVGFISHLLPAVGYYDVEAMFILGRATMNFIDTCGIHTVKAAPDASDRKLLRAIGFKDTESGEFFCDMSGMFDGHCDGHSVELN